MNQLSYGLYDGMIKIPSRGDGSCFFHSVLNAVFVEYREITSLPTQEERERKIRELVFEFRSGLAERLEQKDKDGKTVYSRLSRGSLEEFSKTNPKYTLENLLNELRSTSDVDYVYFELVSDSVNIDIYVIDENSKKPYKIGDNELLIKNRPSIVLLFSGNHYDLVGVRTSSGEFQTIFDPKHPFIQKLKTTL